MKEGRIEFSLSFLEPGEISVQNGNYFATETQIAYLKKDH